MTKKEAVIIEAYTGVCMLKGEDRNLFYKYINQLMGRKVYMYETLALEREIKEKAEPDFIKICKNLGKKQKTRKFRAMTNSEFCDKWRKNHLFCKSIASDSYCCPISPTGNCLRESFLNKPYIINSKYIMIEVTNDA